MVKCKNAFMRTTIDLPDDLFQEIKSRAVRQRRSLKEEFLQLVMNGLRAPSESKQKARDFPAISGADGVLLSQLTPELIKKLEIEGDDERFRRSL